MARQPCQEAPSQPLKHLRLLPRQRRYLQRCCCYFQCFLPFIHGPFFWACLEVSAQGFHGRRSSLPQSCRAYAPRYPWHTACTRWNYPPWWRSHSCLPGPCTGQHGTCQRQSRWDAPRTFPCPGCALPRSLPRNSWGRPGYRPAPYRRSVPGPPAARSWSLYSWYYLGQRLWSRCWQNRRPFWQRIQMPVCWWDCWTARSWSAWRSGQTGAPQHQPGLRIKRKHCLCCWCFCPRGRNLHGNFRPRKCF